MNDSISGLVARVNDWYASAEDACCGSPPAGTKLVLATLRQFLREGSAWRGLCTTGARASGSTLQRSW